MEAQPVQYAPEARPAQRGFVLVPSRPEGAPSYASPEAAPQARPSSGGSVISVSARAATQAEGRSYALEDAARQAAARGLPGGPRILAESFSGGLYTGLVSYQPEDPAPEAPRPPVREGAPARDPDAAFPEAPVRRRPAWILAVPVEAGPRGGTVWLRDSPWSRAWIAPVRRQGMRIVAITGDAEERERLTPALLDDPDSPRAVQALLGIARKYGAPAVSLVRQDGAGGLRAWVWWRDGQVETGDASGSGPGAREAALALIASLAAPAAPAREDRPEAEETPAGPPEVDLEEHQEVAGGPGEFGFAVVLDTRKQAEISAVRRAVSAIPGTWVRDTRVDPEGLEITGVFQGGRAEFERALAAAGLRVARY